MCVDTHLLFLTDLSLSATHVEGKINHNAKSLSWSVSKTLRRLDFKFTNLSKGHFHHCILSEQLGKSFTVFRFSSIHALQHLVKRILHLENASL